MKLNKILFAAAITAAAMFAASCNIVPEPEPGPGPGQDTIPGQDTTVVGDVLTVAQAIAAQDASVKYVQGYVVGWYSNHTNDRCVVFSAAATADTTVLKTNIVLADAATETDATKVVCVQLPVGPLRDALNLNANPSILGATVKVHGSLTAYNSLPGVKEIDEAWLNGTKIKTTVDPSDLVGDGSRTNPYTYADVAALNNPATKAWVKAIIVGQVAGGATSLSASTFQTADFTANGETGQNTNVLLAATAGETDINKVMGLQLSSGAIRDGLNLIQNPTMMGKEVLVYGSLENYFGRPGVKAPTYVEVVGGANFGQDPDVAVVEPTATVATVAEFNAAPVNTTVPGVYYELTGTIGGSINTTYGNFTLTDATGSVTVYGLTATYIPLASATKATNDKSYASLGLVAGDNITIRGVRVDYNNAPEVIGAYFVKKN